MLVIRAGIHKLTVQCIANKEDPDQTTSSEACAVCQGLFDSQLVFEMLEFNFLYCNSHVTYNIGILAFNKIAKKIHIIHWPRSYYTVSTCVIKIVTFKGGHLIWQK